MPTIISHPAIVLTTAMVGGRKRISGRLLIAAIIASILPDADSIGVYFNIPYGHLMGHRGFFHSISFAFMVGLLGLLLASKLKSSRIAAFLVLFISTVSHGLLDAFTSGGLGIAFFSPISNERFFFPWQFIEVAPLSLMRFLTLRGWKVLQSEFVWVWLPLLAVGVIGMLCRKIPTIHVEKQPRNSKGARG